MGDIPHRFAATGAEMAVSITRAVTHHRIGTCLTFGPGTLDSSLLARAARLSLDAEPTLGCSFVTEARRAYWLRLPSLDDVDCFSVSESGDPDADMAAFQTAEVPDSGPQAAVALFRTPAADHLGIKVSHVLADGQAAKRYAYLLADIYSRLAADGSYVPVPNLRARPTGKDVWARLSPAQRRAARHAKSWVKPTWTVPSHGSSGRGLTYRTTFLEPDAFRRLKAFGRRREATINDLMLAAVFRACVALFDPPEKTPLSLMSTADLRRYLPDPEGLPMSNVSISGSLDIERIDGETFDETLARVRQSMAAWAGQCYGARPLRDAETLTRLGYGVTAWLLGLAFRGGGGGSGKTYPWYTNIGVLDHDRLSFAGSTPSSGHMFGPIGRGAAIIPVISTYRDRLAIAMGFCEEDIDAALVGDFMGRVHADLLQVAGPSSARVLAT